MKKFGLPFFLPGIVIVSIVIAASVFFIYRNGIDNSNKKYSKMEYREPQKSSPAARKDELYSGPVSSFPWDNDENFRMKQGQNNTPILMAGFRTVLRDPLPGEEYNVHLAAQMLAGTTVKPGETFSQNNKIGPYTESRGFKTGPTYIGQELTTTTGGGVCKIASTLYNVAVLSNLPIVERHAHGMPVPYVPYGQDATVSYGAQDLKFKNTTSFPVLIWAKGADNILYIGFYGGNRPPKVEWHHEMVGIKRAPGVYKKNPGIPAGTEKRISDGMDGAEVRSWITLEKSDGTKETREMGKSSYMPMPYTIETNK